uniref:Uncharacterized protein n=1 Tax=Oryza nivara TaxID=4536 RepID=A0A0E0ICT1_ORYNI
MAMIDRRRRRVEATASASDGAERERCESGSEDCTIWSIDNEAPTVTSSISNMSTQSFKVAHRDKLCV